MNLAELKDTVLGYHREVLTKRQAIHEAKERQAAALDAFRTNRTQSAIDKRAKANAEVEMLSEELAELEEKLATAEAAYLAEKLEEDRAEFMPSYRSTGQAGLNAAIQPHVLAIAQAEAAIQAHLRALLEVDPAPFNKDLAAVSARAAELRLSPPDRASRMAALAAVRGTIGHLSFLLGDATRNITTELEERFDAIARGALSKREWDDLDPEEVGNRLAAANYRQDPSRPGSEFTPDEHAAIQKRLQERAERYTQAATIDPLPSRGIEARLADFRSLPMHDRVKLISSLYDHRRILLRLTKDERDELVRAGMKPSLIPDYLKEDAR